MTHKKQRVFVFIMLCIILFLGAFVVSYCFEAKASAPGVWVCMASCKNKDSCDATARSSNKRHAGRMAEILCEDKCGDKCRVEACARRR